MGLATYKAKRSFEKTSEPQGGNADKATLRFVVQKHDASHLHYDFRLEMDGVLKSWAVPKEPSLDPSVKRLAMMVEDHPYDYRNFEGIIPKGQYGGGTVMVWDEGTYEPLSPGKTKKMNEKDLLQQLKEGSVKVRLKGKKLKGEFALVKTKGMAENAWLLIKHNDKYATETDVLKKDKSVLSKKSIAQLEKTSDNIYDGTKEPKTKKSEAQKPEDKLPLKPKKTVSKAKLLPKTEETPAFKKIQPMLATLVSDVPKQGDWIYEIKWDGYRAVTFMDKKEVILKSRNNKPFTEKYYPIANALKAWNVNAVVDGELVVVGENGLANFGDLQNWRSEADGELLYYVFDLLWLDGHDIRELPLFQRRELLKKLAPTDGSIRMSQDFDASGEEFLSTAKKMGLEGIMAKARDSVYETGQRNKNWLKIKANKRQEMVIGGYTINEGTAKHFSALLVGVYEGDKLVYMGKIGTGFDVAQQKALLKEFESLKVSVAPFELQPDVNKPSRFRSNPPHASVVWLKPQLVCEVNYTELTADGVMRHPAFVGMRNDKKAKEVKLEKAVAINDTASLGISKTKDSEVKTLVNPTEQTQSKKINGHLLKFTNLKKIFWPGEGVTKGDVINYYHQMAEYILPYLKNRPQSLNRYPNGIKEKSFYQKDVTDKAPSWADTFLYHAGDSKEDKHFLLGNNEAALLYMANLGCIELHPWNSTIKKPENPTWCIIDLDPDKNTFEQVILAAQTTKQICDHLGLKCFCKTSGSTGLHIYLPLNAKYDYEESKEFARALAGKVQRELPKFTTLERTVSARKGKMYIDFLQNRHHATVAAPYSLRPKPGACVSMPLHWDEVKKGLKLTDFNIQNAYARVLEMGDIFKPVLEKGIDLQKAMKKMESL